MPSRIAVLLAALALSSGAFAQSIFTIAGGGTDDGRPATVATIYPSGLALDGAGDIYLIDQLSFRVRKMSARTGIITTVAGNGTSGFTGDGGPATSASLADPQSIAFDRSGNLYIADTFNNRIRKVSAGSGIITTVAGTGRDGFSGDGGPATAAALSLPSGVVVDSAGTLYIADTLNNRVRRISAAGVITTVAGSEGIAAVALAFDRGGSLYIAGNNRIRKLNVTTGVIGDVAGNGSRGFSGDGGPATNASLNMFDGQIALDRNNNLYISDQVNHRIRKVTAGSGVITTIAGSATSGFSGDGGPATAAALRNPLGIVIDSSGALYVADSDNGRIRKVTTNGVIATAAGRGFSAQFGDGGPATAAPLLGIRRVAVDQQGNVYFSEGGGNRIRRVDSATNVISTVAGVGLYGSSGDGGPATLASFYTPEGLAVDAAGNVYIADYGNSRVRKVMAATGVITTIAGNGTPAFAGDGGPATAASLRYPNGVALDASGNLYIADTYNHRIRKIHAQTGIITSVAGGGSIDSDGGPATATELAWPYDVVVDSSNNLYISEGNRVRKVSAASGLMTTHAGQGTEGYWGDGGAATAAGLRRPEALALHAGDLYIADVSRIRKVSAASGIITTVAGGGASFADHGPATATSMLALGVAVDTFGNLYVTDGLTKRVRAVFRCVSVASPTLHSPASGSNGVSTSPRIAWSAVHGAFRYDVLLDTVSPPMTSAAADISTTTFAPANLQPLTTYYWQVIAKGDPFCTPFSTSASEVRAFTTAGSCDAPGVP